MSWSLTSALNYIRALQPRVMEVGWCLTLAGGVLNKGHSDNDLDLLLYPRTQASRVVDLLPLFPSGTWAQVDGVAAVYAYTYEGRKVELVFQTRSSLA